MSSLKCVSLALPTIDELMAAAKQARDQGAEMIEVRYDQIEPEAFSVEKVLEDLDRLADLPLPWIFTVRSRERDESGGFEGSEEDRVELFRAVIGSKKVQWVDIEYELHELEGNVISELIQKARDNKVKVILSHHNLEQTPMEDEIYELIESLNSYGPDLVKVAFMTAEPNDAIRIMEAANLAYNDGIPIAAMGLGPYSKRTRVYSPSIGNQLVYVSLSKGKETAEGQLTLKDLKETWKVLEYE